MQKAYGVRFWMMLALAMTLAGAAAYGIEIPLADADLSYEGAYSYKYAGWDCSTGDVDGDGLADLLIGGGRVYVLLGKNIGTRTGTTLEEVADASFVAETSGDDFGDAVSMTGDVNNDGFDDIFIGAERFDSCAGKTYLILGKADGWALNTPVLDAAVATFTGENQNDWSGYAVSIAGDLNQDGFDDLLVGAYMVDAGGLVNSGRSYLFWGKSSGWALDTGLAAADVLIDGEAQYNGSGRKIAPAGDVNQDGIDDVLISATGGQNARGEVYLILGRTGTWASVMNLSQADASFYGEVAGDYIGMAISGAGDVNADGFDDILIGADENDDSANRAGKAYLVLGKASGWSVDTDLALADASFLGEAENDHLGRTVAFAGDVNNDGFEDIVLGATWTDQYTGKAYLVYGKSGGWSPNTNIAAADKAFPGEAPYDYAGFSATPAGDVNQDGVDDFLISAAYYGPYYTGKVYLFFGQAELPGDLDHDQDVDGTDLALYADDPTQVAIGDFAANFGS